MVLALVLRLVPTSLYTRKVTTTLKARSSHTESPMMQLSKPQRACCIHHETETH